MNCTQLSSVQTTQLAFESRQLMQATFLLILLWGESGARVKPGPDVDGSDSSEDGVGAIVLQSKPTRTSTGTWN